MSSKGWYSKQDVIKDLAKVTGKRVNDFGQHYVVGTDPPPIWNNEQDDEDLSRFYGGQTPTQTDDIEKPDLVGITQMLRMVDNYNEGPSEENKSNKAELTNIIVSISKLDPNVSEFDPSTIKQEQSTLNVWDSKYNEEPHTKNKQLPLDVKKPVQTDSCDTKVRDNQTHIPYGLKEMREKLKTRITKASNVNCVRQKRDRNLAINTLVKLYSKRAVEETKPNLISPEYFINNSANKITRTNEEAGNNSTTDHLTEDTLNASMDTEIISKEIAASVEKVTKWLCSSETETLSECNGIALKDTNSTEEKPMTKATKVPLIHLGPVTFKRKTNNRLAISPVSLLSDTKTNKSETYIPSNYANELTKKYSEQSQQRQSQPDLWASIENKLKEKDEELKKQRRVQ
ncbi:uncharacterized protein LOC116775353 [Danaus plexippus]|uniref:uncharacterized protein LOC116775353 n=1 Tax=Danaus plexippus TaxID=13037 RepID=UPI002AAFDA40|nr:uncharacterized protein LOC116775353 [Danaus plexippus]XP_032524146.2 uncharacterized protein LOC116775353 [Danaus plexippus]